MELSPGQLQLSVPRVLFSRMGYFSAFLLECFDIFERASHQELKELQGAGIPDPADMRSETWRSRLHGPMITL